MVIVLESLPVCTTAFDTSLNAGSGGFAFADMSRNRNMQIPSNISQWHKLAAIGSERPLQF